MQLEAEEKAVESTGKMEFDKGQDGPKLRRSTHQAAKKQPTAAMSLLNALLLEGHRDPRDVWIALRADGQRGSGTIDDPYDGSTKDRFDSLLRGFTQELITIHIGPGEFQTNGNAAGDANQGWKVRRGWKIKGSGIDVTTLKVVGANNTNGLYFAIGIKVYGEFADHAEVMDLTVDCNLAGNPSTAVAAVFLNGSHTRIRRVKAINWGTETDSAECFVLAIGGAHPDLLSLSSFTDGIIEDCICVQPHENNRRETTVILCFGGDNPFDHRWAFSQSPVLRRNFVDCGFSNGHSSFLLTAASLTRSGAVATCETYRPHERTTGQRVRISRAVDSSHSAHWFGYFTITKLDDYRFTYTMDEQPPAGETSVTGVVVLVGTSFQALSIGSCSGGLVEDNVVRNSWIGGPYQDTYHTREIIVRRNHYQNVAVAHYTSMGKVSGGPRDIESIKVVPGTDRAEVTIKEHGFGNGEFINVTKVTPTDYVRLGVQVENPSANTFRYALVSVPMVDGNGGIVERRSASLTSLTHLGSGIAEAACFLDTDVGHQLEVGDRIKVSNATQGAADFTPKNEFNGFFEITEVSGSPQPNKFRYITNGIPSGNAFNATFQRVWGVDRLMVEDNVIELREAFSYEYGLAIGISVLDEGLIVSTSGLPPFVHGDIIIRRNIIRFTGGIVDASFAGLGIFVAGAEQLLVEENVIDLADPAPVRHERCGEVHYFNTQTSDGKLVRGVENSGQDRLTELQDAIEDAMML